MSGMSSPPVLLSPAHEDSVSGNRKSFDRKVEGNMPWHSDSTWFPWLFLTAGHRLVAFSDHGADHTLNHGVKP